MNRKRFFISIIILMLFVTNISFSQENDTIVFAVVDFKSVYLRYSKVQELKKELEQMREQKERDLKEIEKEIYDLENNLNVYLKTDDDNKIKLILNQLIKKRQELSNKREKANEELKQYQEQQSKPILDEIKKVVDAVRKQKKIDIIFDASGILSYDNSYDLTELVLKTLEANFGNNR